MSDMGTILVIWELNIVILVVTCYNYSSLPTEMLFWANYSDLTVLPKPGIMVYFRGIIAKWPNISGELLQCAQTFAIKTIDFTMKNIQT
jgi:hypothetical protein